MKRFRFPLKPVAILRAHQEMRAREAFAAAVHAYVKSEEELAQARQRLAQFERELAEGRRERFSPAGQAHALAAYRNECSVVMETEKAMIAARAAMQQRRTEYLEAHRKVEVIKRLETRAREEHRLECNREEQANFDDFAGRQFAARNKALASP